MVLFDGIQSIKGIPRKFGIGGDDYEKTNWATKTDVEQVGEIVSQQIAETVTVVTAAISNSQHSSLLGITANDHHNKVHGDTHTKSGSDPLKPPLEIADDDGNTLFKIDTSGNLFIKGRLLKI